MGLPEQVNRAIIDTTKSEINTSMPCLITEIITENENQVSVVNIKPMFRTRYADGTAEDRPIILSVPVMANSSTYDIVNDERVVQYPYLEIGDTVMVSFSQRSIEAMNTRLVHLPTTARKFDLTDAIVIGLLF